MRKVFIVAVLVGVLVSLESAIAGNICNCKGYAGVGGPCYAGPGGLAYDGLGGPAM